MNEFKVGLMALMTMLAVAYMSVKVTSNQSGFGDYVTYKTIIDDASGIFPKTPIKVAGINAGRIKKIELQDNKALITFEVLSDVIIVEGSQLRIKTVGFLGDKYLEIIVGQSEKRLAQDSLVPSQQSGGMANLVKDASVLMSDVKEIVTSLKETLAPSGEDSPLKKILKNFEEMSKNSSGLTADLKALIDENKEKLGKLISNFEKFSSNMAQQTDKNVSDSMVAELHAILANAKKMTNDMQVIAENFKNGKGTLGKLMVDDTIADEVQQTLSGVNRLVNRVNQIQTELGIFTGANTEDGSDTDTWFKIYPAPERFYLLGLRTSEFGPESETHRTTEANGASNTIVTKEKDKNTFRFNVQLGRRVHNWSFRAGLIESTGGLGLDYDLYGWGTKFSLDLYDYRDDIGINLRLGSQVKIWNVVYGRFELEDMIEESRSATFAAGLRFSDEDLRALIGFFF